ncbi:MAG: alpha/beta fold hydrolase, partial [Pseudomonadota bacterium]
PEGGWPLVVWAHGTTGVARQCGPSATKSLGYYSNELIDELMQRGIALLVVDYAGLSTAGAPHQYMAKTTNALDIESAVPAARAAVNSLSSEWLAIGHSQGGAAVWGLAEQKALRPDTGYLGSIALAPAVGGADLINNNSNLERETFYPVYWAHAIKVQSPEFSIDTMLTEQAISLYEQLTANGCWDYGFALSASLAPGTVLKAGWEDLPPVQQFLTSIRSGEQRIAGPLFVAAGREDIGVREEFIENAVRAQCETGADVLYRVYPGTHDGMMETSFGDQINWIEERFAGVATQVTNCE